MEHPWIVDQAIARVEGFGSQTLVKLVGFIKGGCMSAAGVGKGRSIVGEGGLKAYDIVFSVLGSCDKREGGGVFKCDPPLATIVW